MAETNEEEEEKDTKKEERRRGTKRTVGSRPSHHT